MNNKGEFPTDHCYSKIVRDEVEDKTDADLSCADVTVNQEEPSTSQASAADCCVDAEEMELGQRPAMNTKSVSSTSAPTSQLQKLYPYCTEAGINPKTLLNWKNVRMNKCVIKNGLALEIHQIFKQAGRQQIEAVRCMGKLSKVKIQDRDHPSLLRLTKTPQRKRGKDFLQQPVTLSNGRKTTKRMREERAESLDAQSMLVMRQEVEDAKGRAQKAVDELEEEKVRLQETRKEVVILKRKIMYKTKVLKKKRETNDTDVEEVRARVHELKSQCKAVKESHQKAEKRLAKVVRQTNERREKHRALFSEYMSLHNNLKLKENTIMCIGPTVEKLQQEASEQEKTISDQKVTINSLHRRLEECERETFELYDKESKGYTPETIQCVKELTLLGVACKNVVPVLESVARLFRRNIPQVSQKTFLHQVMKVQRGTRSAGKAGRKKRKVSRNRSKVKETPAACASVSDSESVAETDSDSDVMEIA